MTKKCLVYVFYIQQVIYYVRQKGKFIILSQTFHLRQIGRMLNLFDNCSCYSVVKAVHYSVS